MVIALLVAAAALVWPTPLPSGLRSAGRHAGRSVGRRDSGRPATARVAAGAAILLTGGALSAQWGAAVALSGAILGATVWNLLRRLRSARGRRVALEHIVAALRMLGRELHAGADPTLAAQNTAAAATGEGAAVVSELVRAIGTGDRPSGTVSASSNRLPAGGAPLPGSDSGRAVTARYSASLAPRMLAVSRLRSGWTLTQRYGIAFTPLIDALAAELAEQLVADSQRAGEVAGPRMSGYVMAVLPLLGLLLGAGMGADPVEVLFRTQLGNALLSVGTVLTCAGLLWSARIVAR
jgi:tight adherence protein B